ncbi:hypothetical protein [Microvirga sp. P5_D2]|jgi:hypothetical protein
MPAAALPVDPGFYRDLRERFGPLIRCDGQNAGGLLVVQPPTPTGLELPTAKPGCASSAHLSKGAHETYSQPTRSLWPNPFR